VQRQKITYYFYVAEEAKIVDMGKYVKVRIKKSVVIICVC